MWILKGQHKPYRMRNMDSKCIEPSILQIDQNSNPRFLHSLHFQKHRGHYLPHNLYIMPTMALHTIYKMINTASFISTKCHTGLDKIWKFYLKKQKNSPTKSEPAVGRFQKSLHYKMRNNHTPDLWTIAGLQSG